ncbi:putative MFS family arabinose efflux permease [Povalibacter uvarum]|uniref:Putative MFS family arabinose efflux permease n=1 Tax=Povalibacter uvarum TaxID=732238 RepID=A0A841HMV2_9GAMM|nr:MFS transporter [Povalibacter uvarum]MBB6094447.1 putative MFS family arabinose efflux permease [Povalibacter uvarum]
MTHSLSQRQIVVLTVTAAAILMITMGTRQTSGLFLLPITQSTGVTIVAFSFALAIGQFMFGLAQPIFAAIADKYGAIKVIVAGGLMMALGSFLTPYVSSGSGLLFTMGILGAAGAAAGSFSILIGIAAQRLPAEKRSFASGFINAGGSFGQLIFAPVVQAFIGFTGWVSAMFFTAAAALLTIPLALLLRQTGKTEVAVPSPVAVPHIGLGEQVREAMRNPSYLYLHIGFFTCGFHVAFLVTHLPSELELCGLAPTVAAYSLSLIGGFNVAGSLIAGWLGQRYRMKYLLAWIYGSRALIVMIYMVMPKTALNVYLFAGALGFTWLATVPPTAGLVGKLFGTRYIATLFGLTLVSHQVGGFLGAWLGGVAVAQTGSYEWIWYADIALALMAAAINFPIREARLQAQPQPA